MYFFFLTWHCLAKSDSQRNISSNVFFSFRFQPPHFRPRATRTRTAASAAATAGRRDPAGRATRQRRHREDGGCSQERGALQPRRKTQGEKCAGKHLNSNLCHVGCAFQDSANGELSRTESPAGGKTKVLSSKKKYRSRSTSASSQDSLSSGSYSGRHLYAEKWYWYMCLKKCLIKYFCRTPFPRKI